MIISVAAAALALHLGTPVAQDISPEIQTVQYLSLIHI